MFSVGSGIRNKFSQLADFQSAAAQDLDASPISSGNLTDQIQSDAEVLRAATLKLSNIVNSSFANYFDGRRVLIFEFDAPIKFVEGNDLSFNYPLATYASRGTVTSLGISIKDPSFSILVVKQAEVCPDRPFYLDQVSELTELETLKVLTDRPIESFDAILELKNLQDVIFLSKNLGDVRQLPPLELPHLKTIHLKTKQPHDIDLRNCSNLVEVGLPAHPDIDLSSMLKLGQLKTLDLYLPTPSWWGTVGQIVSFGLYNPSVMEYSKATSADIEKLKQRGVTVTSKLVDFIGENYR